MADFRSMMAAKNKKVNPSEDIRKISENKSFEEFTDVESKINKVLDMKEEKPSPTVEPVVKAAKEVQEPQNIQKPQNQQVKQKKQNQQAIHKVKENEVKNEPASSQELVVFSKKAVMLTHELNRFMRIRAKQKKLSMDKYFNVVIDGIRERNIVPEDPFTLYEACNKKYNGNKERSTIGLTEQNTNYVVTVSENSGITITDFLNFIIELEMKNEAVE